jgi:hypothetical protein
MNDLNAAAEFGAPGRRPLLMAAGFVAIAALGLSGLYQGFRFTWRDYGPAPSYAQIATAATQVAPQPIADSQPVATEVRDRAAPDPADAAADATPSPPLPLASMVQAAVDGLQATPGAGAPTAPNASIQPTAYSAPLGQPPVQTAPVSDSSATSPTNAGSGQAPAPPPQ